VEFLLIKEMAMYDECGHFALFYRDSPSVAYIGLQVKCGAARS